jgi:hypothetical protein
MVVTRVIASSSVHSMHRSDDSSLDGGSVLPPLDISANTQVFFFCVDNSYLDFPAIEPPKQLHAAVGEKLADRLTVDKNSGYKYLLF